MWQVLQLIITTLCVIYLSDVSFVVTVQWTLRYFTFCDVVVFPLTTTEVQQNIALNIFSIPLIGAKQIPEKKPGRT